MLGLVIVIGIALSIYVIGLVSLARRTREHLGSDSDRRSYAAELKAGHFWSRYGERLYRTRLEGALDLLDTRFGLDRLNPHGLGVCIALAFGYGAALFTGGWALGYESGTIGLDILPAAQPAARGASVAVLLAACGAMAWGVMRTAERPVHPVVGVGGLLALFVVSLCGAHWFAMGQWVPNFVDHYSTGITVMFGAMFISAWALALFVTGRQADGWMVIGGALVAVAVAMSVLGVYQRDRVVLLFLGVLPAVNGVLDWVSWMVSLTLARLLVARRLTAKSIALHGAADLGAALVLLVVLAAALTAGLNLGATGYAPVEIGVEALADPWGSGAWVTLMLVSTLLPTALHALLLLGAALTCQMPLAWRVRRAQELVAGAPEGRRRDALARFLTARWILPPVAFLAVALGLTVPVWLSTGAVGQGLMWVVAEADVMTHSTRAEIARFEVRLRRCAQNHWTRRMSDVPAHLRDASRSAGHAAWQTLRDRADVGVELLESASACLARTDTHAEALIAQRRLIELEPDRARHHYNAGLISQAMNAHADALTAFRAAAALEPANPVYRLSLARGLGRMKQVGEATAFADELLAEASDDAALYDGVAQAMFALAEYERAHALAARAARLEPDNAVYQSSLGAVSARLERLDEALAAHDRAVALAPDDARHHRQRALTLARMERPDDALAANERALALDPDDADHHVGRAVNLIVLDRLDEALTAAERAVELAPEDPSAHFAYSAVLEKQGRLEAALAAQERAVTLGPDSAVYLGSLGVILRSMKRYDEALEATKESLRRDPDSIIYRYEYGLILHDLERYDEALVAKTRAADAQPEVGRYHAGLAHTLRSMERFYEALEAIDRALVLEPENADWHHERGHILEDLGQFTAAQAALTRAVYFDPSAANHQSCNSRLLEQRSGRRSREASDSLNPPPATEPYFPEATTDAPPGDRPAPDENPKD